MTVTRIGARSVAGNANSLVIFVLALCGVGVLGLASVWLYERALPPVKESEAPGSGPVALFRYRASGPEPPELYCEPRKGSTLSDLFDMALFDDAKPGMTLVAFAKRYGSKQFHGTRAVLEAGLEENLGSPSLGTITYHPLYAFPKPDSGGIDLAAAVNSAIATEIRRTNFAGVLILADSADTERLFCSVDGTKIFKIRWVRW